MMIGYRCYIFPTYSGVLAIPNFFSFLSFSYTAFHTACKERRDVNIIFFSFFRFFLSIAGKHLRRPFFFSSFGFHFILSFTS